MRYTAMAARSWRHSPSSHEWPLRRTLSPRSKPRRTRRSGCITYGWNRRIELSVNTRKWLRERSNNERQLDACLDHHGQVLGRRMSLGSTTSPYRLREGGLLVVQTRCSREGVLHTTVHLKLGRKP